MIDSMVPCLIFPVKPEQLVWLDTSVFVLVRSACDVQALAFAGPLH